MGIPSKGGSVFSLHLGGRRESDPFELGASVEAAGDLTAPGALSDTECKLHPPFSGIINTGMSCCDLRLLKLTPGYSATLAIGQFISFLVRTSLIARTCHRRVEWALPPNTVIARVRYLD
jgi:hypothetical protein